MIYINCDIFRKHFIEKNVKLCKFCNTKLTDNKEKSFIILVIIKRIYEIMTG